jgi:hypothetical protein
VSRYFSTTIANIWATEPAAFFAVTLMLSVSAAADSRRASGTRPV